MRRLLILPLLVAALTAAEPVSVAPEVAKLLTAVQDQPDASKALALLDAYKGPEHALIHLARGQTLTRLALAAPAADRERQRSEAVNALNVALQLDHTLNTARLSLAQLAADSGAWSEAVAHCGAAISLADANVQELLFYTQCAYQAKDWRLATTLVTQGIARFPSERSLRRYELALLVNGDRPDEARQAVLALLAAEPSDAELWRHLSWSAHELKRSDEALAALEIALIAKPADATLRRQLAQAQLGAGMPQAALVTIAPLLDQTSDGAVVELAARIAGDTGDPARGRAWLAAVPADQRTRGQRLLTARLALQAQEPVAATAALAELVALGEQDAAVLVWAGQVAEQANDQPTAESFYAQAITSDAPAAAIASLRLVSLYVKQERIEDAQTLLASHLAKRPDDAQAKALLAQLSRRSK